MDRGRRPSGCVFYTRQDAANLRRDLDRGVGTLFLGFGPLVTMRHGEIGLPIESVGDAVMAALAANGIDAVWNRDPGRKIEVRVSSL